MARGAFDRRRAGLDSDRFRRPPGPARQRAPMSTLQTLERGLSALEAIARRPGGISTAELAAELGVHRAIAYRIVATLEAHGLVVRAGNGQLMLGGQVVALSTRFRPQLRALAQPILEQLAQETGATAFLTVAEGDQCVAVATAEPEGGVLRVSYRVGSRHPVTAGAAGIAILSGRPAAASDTAEVRAARNTGYVLTTGQIQAGATGIAAPIAASATGRVIDASIGVVTMGNFDVRFVGEKVVEAAARIAGGLGTAR